MAASHSTRTESPIELYVRRIEHGPIHVIYYLKAGLPRSAKQAVLQELRERVRTRYRQPRISMVGDEIAVSNYGGGEAA